MMNPSDPDNVESELLRLLREGQKLQAIKHYREHAGVGLKEAKQAVEELGERHGVLASRSGCFGIMLTAMALTGALALACFA